MPQFPLSFHWMSSWKAILRWEGQISSALLDFSSWVSSECELLGALDGVCSIWRYVFHSCGQKYYLVFIQVGKDLSSLEACQWVGPQSWKRIKGVFARVWYLPLALALGSISVLATVFPDFSAFSRFRSGIFIGIYFLTVVGLLLFLFPSLVYPLL